MTATACTAPFPPNRLTLAQADDLMATIRRLGPVGLLHGASRRKGSLALPAPALMAFIERHRDMWDTPKEAA